MGPDVEAKYFMAYGWLTHEACSKLSCLADNMRWNRNGSGCIKSLITGRTAPIYNDNDIACEKNDEVNPSDGSELCKYDTTDLQLYQTRLNDCWDRDDPNPTSRVPYYILEHFCMPEITGEKIDEDIIHPCQFPCHGISLVLSDDDKSTILSDNSSNETIVKCFDTSEVTNMDQFLMGSNINADLSSWDVSSVTNMHAMFYQAHEFDNDISSWDVSSVTNMLGMFKWSTIYNKDISSWDVSAVTTMESMFFAAEHFEQKMCEWNLEGKNVQNMFT